MQYRLLKFYSKRFVDWGKTKNYLMRVAYVAGFIGAVIGQVPLALGTMTISPVNGTLPVATPKPYVQGSMTFNYYVQQDSPASSLGNAFLDPSITSLSVSRGTGYTCGSPFSGTDGSTSRAVIGPNAFGVNISTTATIQASSTSVPVIMIQIQTGAGLRYVPIAGVGGANGSNPAACSSTNCSAFNLNNVVTVPTNFSGTAPWYAGTISGNNFSVYFYPKDICSDLYQSTYTGCGASSGNGAVTFPSPGPGLVTMNLNFVIRNLPVASPTPIPTSNPVDSTRNPVSLSFQTASSTFTCPNLSSVTIQPDDSRIYIDSSQFSLSGGLAPGNSLVVVAQDSLVTASAPVLNSTFMDSGVNSLYTSNASGSYNNALFVAPGFTNSTSTVTHPYYLGFLIQDAAGIYTPPASSPPFVPGGRNLSCAAFGPIQTSNVYGFLPSDQRCFIATAAFQSRDAIPVQMLREFRDRVLLQFEPGRAFVGWYYGWSPRAADWLDAHPPFRLPVLLGLFELQVVAWLCLHPMVFVMLFSSALGLGLGWLKMNQKDSHAS